MTLGYVDSYLFDPWWPRELWLYSTVGEALAQWSHSQPPDEVAATVIGAESEPRAHESRDALERIDIPYVFHSDTWNAGRAGLARLGRADARRGRRRPGAPVSRRDERHANSE